MESLESIQARHRKEQRDLQSRITNKKKNATKKTRKGVNDECAQIERELRERQEREIAAATGEGDGGGAEAEAEAEADEDESGRGAANGARDGTGDDDDDDDETNGIAARLRDTTLPNSSPPTPSQRRADAEPNDQATQTKTQGGAGGGGGGGGKKRNRQKERMARRAAEVEAAAEAAEQEAANMTDHRKIEKTYLLREFKKHDLAEHEIQPDGHCLFSAVADQLRHEDVPLAAGGSGVGAGQEKEEGKENGDGGRDRGMPPYRAVRRAATRYMRDHPDDFAPFLVDEEGGLEGYARKMADTAEWGGQLELLALANWYGVRIRVLQDGRTETIEPTTGDRGSGDENGNGKGEGERKTIWLAYYRHGYGLGEHYNSLRKAS